MYLIVIIMLSKNSIRYICTSFFCGESEEEFIV